VRPKLAVVGVGLIGGSIGIAARERLGAQVHGFDPGAGVLAAARERGVLDHICTSVGDAVEGAEIVFVAAPVGALPDLVAEALEAAAPDAVVTDVGSTKRAIVAATEDPRFVGGHPLAGAETAGVAHARADLFEQATWYLTPTERTAGDGYERLHRTIAGLGALPTAIGADAHDRLMAGVSHLPHVLANVLVSQVASAQRGAGEHLPSAGPSFRDATRVAGANPAIWTDIYRSNRDVIAAGIDETITRLQSVRDALSSDDSAAIEAWNAAAAEDRRSLLERELTGGPVHELRASVPNQPGVVAEVALELGRAGIGIVDMALYPAPDAQAGVIALWIASDDQADRAQTLVEALGYPVGRP
jgi:prephenate dehydrogenase